MVQADFKPSEVIPYFPHSSMHKYQHGVQREVVAAMIVCYLAANGDEWKEIEWVAFTTYLRSGNAPVVPDYHAHCTGTPLQQVLIATGSMLHEGVLTFRQEDGVDYISVGEPLFKFYKDYVQKPAV
jgi:hypothetical protein